eukprot:1140142-Pelagomonas_calceolata.AAC.2
MQAFFTKCDVEQVVMCYCGVKQVVMCYCGVELCVIMCYCKLETYRKAHSCFQVRVLSGPRLSDLLCIHPDTALAAHFTASFIAVKDIHPDTALAAFHCIANSATFGTCHSLSP